MKKVITIEEFDRLNEKDKKIYKIVYLDYETQSVHYGYILK
nr:hypothetical protein [uncultured Fusobacterium sp.]